MEEFLIPVCQLGVLVCFRTFRFLEKGGAVDDAVQVPGVGVGGGVCYSAFAVVKLFF